jgi:hypothetical protein
MSRSDATTWLEANQRHLMAAVAAVRRRLESHVAAASADPVEEVPPAEVDAGASAHHGAP